MFICRLEYIVSLFPSSIWLGIHVPTHYSFGGSWGGPYVVFSVSSIRAKWSVSVERLAVLTYTGLHSTTQQKTDRYLVWKNCWRGFIIT